METRSVAMPYNFTGYYIHTGRIDPEIQRSMGKICAWVSCLYWESVPLYIHSLDAHRLPKTWVQEVLQNESHTNMHSCGWKEHWS